MMVTYGLCQHHVNNARLMVETGQLHHDATMRHLKAVYEGRRAYMVAMDKYRSLNDIGGDYCRDGETYEQRVLNVSWRVVNAIIDHCEQPSEALSWWLDQDARAEFAHVETQYIKDLAQTARKIHTFFYGLASFDTHRANVMVDNNGRLIITDPVSWTQADHQDELQGKLNAIAE
ncbi:hypothetical protein F0D05_14705 [Salmonella enterica]|nr:hypothetical protein [Salmonella enterica subsp. enterica serovar Kentucky]